MKQPAGKAGEVLDGKLAGNIDYGVCISCYESLASHILPLMLSRWVQDEGNFGSLSTKT